MNDECLLKNDILQETFNVVGKKRISQCGIKLHLTESSRAMAWATGRIRPISSGQDTEDMLAREEGGYRLPLLFSILFFCICLILYNEHTPLCIHEKKK